MMNLLQKLLHNARLKLLFILVCNLSIIFTIMIIDYNKTTDSSELNIDKYDRQKFGIYIYMHDLDISENSTKVNISIYTGIAKDDRNVCIKRVALISDYILKDHNITKDFDKPLCQGGQDSDQPYEIEGNVILRHEREYWYPFDYIYSYLDLQLDTYTIYKERQIDTGNIPVYVNIFSNYPSWDSTFYKDKYISIYTPIILRLHRPYSQIILTITSIVLLLAFILLIALIRDIGSLIQGAAGVMFGIWGIRQVILPTKIGELTFLDFTFIFIYTSLGFVIFLQLYDIILLNRTLIPNEDSMEEISLIESSSAHTIVDNQASIIDSKDSELAAFREILETEKDIIDNQRSIIADQYQVIQEYKEKSEMLQQQLDSVKAKPNKLQQIIRVLFRT